MAQELPNSQDMEKAVLGALMIYPDAMTACMDMDLKAEEFYVPAHQTLYRCIEALHEQGYAVDTTTVVDRLRSHEELPAAGGADYVLGLADFAISSATVHTNIEIIKNKAQLRRLIRVSEEIINDCYEADDMDEILDEAEKNIMDVTRDRRGSEFESSREVVSRVLTNMSRLKNHHGVVGIKTGYTDLDRMTNGFQRGDLIILAARPAMGKSALALNFVNQVAKRNDGAVALFSLEMPADQLMMRLLSCESQVPSEKIRSARISDSETSSVNAAGSLLSERHIFIDDTSSVRIPEIFSKCRKLQSEEGSLSLIVIDYLQLITGPIRSDSRQQEVSYISRNLKILAKEMNCPVVALSQLSRKVEERPDHRPQLSDLRESGSIEQDADIVMFLYRAGYYDRDNEEPSDTEVVQVNLAKHRNGAIGQIDLAFEKKISRFTSLKNTGGDDVYAH